jgi:putative phosphonate metabolism protein
MTVDLSKAHRFAVYFSPPPGSAWWDAGSRWLGRDAATGTALEPPRFDGLAPETQQRLTADPRRYGWHATLKAPFVLSEGVGLDDLREALRALAASFTAFDMPALRVRRLGGFLALCPEGNKDAINAVASACVTQLAKLAAPLSSDELERRRRKGSLSTQEDALLVRWGYPYVLERYRCHLSLTGHLQGVDETTVQRLEQAAQAWFEALPPCPFDGLSLFAEPTQGADFVFVERWGLSR